MNISNNPWIWVMGIGMLCIYSFLYKENPFYRFFEHVYVGAGAGYAIALGWQNIYNQAITPMTQDGRWSLIIPVILGLLLYTRFIKGIAWLSRWAMAFLAGVGAGLAMYGVVNAQFLAQIRANMLPLNSINNAILVFGVLSILIYFFFSLDHKGPINYASKGGRWLMMVTFGVSFGNVVMGRISLLLGALQKILGSWLGIIAG